MKIEVRPSYWWFWGYTARVTVPVESEFLQTPYLSRAAQVTKWASTREKAVEKARARVKKIQELDAKYASQPKNRTTYHDL